jgi:hypothetical protein
MPAKPKLADLPSDKAACLCCGIAAEDPGPGPSGPTRVLLTAAHRGEGVPLVTVRLTRCAPCLDRWNSAVELADSTPIGRLDEPPRPYGEGSTNLGGVYLRHSAESWRELHERMVIAAAKLDLGARALPDLLAACGDLRWLASPRFALRQCAASPWSHLTRHNLDAARRGYAVMLHWRTLRSAPPVTVPAPDGGCLLCGVRALQVGARAEHRRQVEGASPWWRRRSLRVGQRPLDGFVCPSCDELLEDHGGLHHALVAVLRDGYAGVPSEEPMDVIGLAWASVARRPNREPWQHLPAELIVTEHGERGLVEHVAARKFGEVRR